MAKDFMIETRLTDGTLLQNGKYRIERSIASGGFGNTYLVTNTVFNEQMALKEFFIRGISERESDHTTVAVSNTLNREQFDLLKDKFKKEALRLRKLRNPHIVKVHDLFEENGTAYYAMELIEGMSLAQRLKNTGQPVDETEAYSILRQLLDALEEVHGLGIWHLDLKPGNVLIDKDGRAVLIDFGASKQLKSNEGYSTTAGMCYTPGYAPTEQIEQNLDRLGPWTDIYALGATFYNLLTCEPPPSVSDLQEDDAFVFPKPVRERTITLIKWMMSPNRSKRPQSIGEIRQFLTRPLKSNTPPATEEVTTFTTADKSERSQRSEKSDRSARSSLLKWGGIAAVALIAIAGAYFALAPKGSDDNVAAEDGDSVVAAQMTKAEQGKNIQSLYYQERDYESKLGKCSYSGPVDEDGKPHGMGVALFSDGRLYQGPFEHGDMTGKGAYFQYSNGDVFQGEFKNNAFYQGRYTIKEDGSYFEGTYSNGQPDKGTWYDKNGKTIE